VDDAELQVLQLAHRASGKLLKGRAVTPLEELTLHAVVRMIEPALSPAEKSRTRQMLREISEIREPHATRWASATPRDCRIGGTFSR
jgi:hypothetical protein